MHSEDGGDPRQTSVTLAPAWVVPHGNEAKGGTLPDWHRNLCIAAATRLGRVRYGFVRRDLTMPTNKDFKRLVRARMEKTGEAYTTARFQLLKQSKPPSTGAPARPMSMSIDYAKLAGMSDAVVKRATGCTWERWVKALDYAGAHRWSHRAIADYVRTTYKTPSWWTQTVTVGYERIKGLRAIGQQRDGGYVATKSKTLPAPAGTVYRAFADGRIRRQWLDGVKLTVRKSTPNRSVRITWDDDTSVEVWLTSKGGGKTSAQVQHRNLVDRVDADRRRAFWAERLDALRDVVNR